MLNLHTRQLNFVAGSGISFFNRIEFIDFSQLFDCCAMNAIWRKPITDWKIYTCVLEGGGHIGLTWDICRLGVPGVGVAGVNWGDVAAFASISRNIERDCLPSPNSVHTWNGLNRWEWSMKIDKFYSHKPCSNTATSSVCWWLTSSLNTSPVSNLFLIDFALSPIFTSDFLSTARMPVHAPSKRTKFNLILF